MYEVELKVRAEHDALRERLLAMGATQSGTISQEDTYYDAPHREFAETDEALRIRREERTADGRRKTKITYKGPLVESESKTREELETHVDDGETVDSIFRRLGFDPVATVEKTRERYEHDGYTIVLDDVTGLGEFVEVETEADVVEPARDGAIQLLSDLGLDPDRHVRTSYLGMLLSGDHAE
ncbi:MAG: class IV adenylate cyclase [Natronomonas sp.]